MKFASLFGKRFLKGSVKKSDNSFTVAIAGNPNVGKSTIFNALTGLKQHTGNWPGKTVGNTVGRFQSHNNLYRLVDIPGTYSLFAHSPEEEIARNFICFGEPDAVIAVCDATCLERNLNLILQITEIHKNVIVCVNFMDEAKRKGIKVDLRRLSERLGTPVVECIARKKKSLKALINQLDKSVKSKSGKPFKVIYPDEIEKAIAEIEKALITVVGDKINIRWLALRLLCYDKPLMAEINRHIGFDCMENGEIKGRVKKASETLTNSGITRESLEDIIVSSIVSSAEGIAKEVTEKKSGYSKTDRKLDKFFTGKKTAYLVMITLLSLVLWITLFGANYISECLETVFFHIEKWLTAFMNILSFPENMQEMIIEGIFRVPFWVTAVMLPPMAIFFPLFTMLEDAGYLPRVAYNLDKPFNRCGGCGKQALTMCMGFGCNAAGVTGCRIIDSKRERLLAVITNSFVPCNGRFPIIIALISMFIASGDGILGTLISSVFLTLFILLGVGMTFLATKIMSVTLLKGESSAYTIEMPPFRRPQYGKVIVRSILDRTIFVLGRSLIAAIPAGIIIYAAANIKIGNASVLNTVCEFLNPLGYIMGLDGVILIAFILGFPANEIVIPIIIMGYLSGSALSAAPGLFELKGILVANGWDVSTGLCCLIFSLFHWPCATTLMTIKKETGSFKWTAVSFLLPTAIGVILCILINFLCRFFV